MKIRIVYFDFNFWRVDILRLSLSYKNIPYEYERIPRKDWLDFKKKYPFEQLPILTIDGRTYCHTHSLAIFCSSISNLYDSDIENQLIINQIIDWANEITYRIAHSIREKNQVKSRKLRKIFIQKDLFTWFRFLENFYIDNSKNSFFTGKFSIADITAWRVIRWFLSGQLEQIPVDFIKDFPELYKFYNRICCDKKFSDLIEFKEIMN